MTISVRGIGWLTEREYGCVRRGSRKAFSAGDGVALPNKELFSYPVKNFGRFDALSRVTCYAVALALKDAGLTYSSSRKQDIGIIGTSREGSLRSDREYFNDYLQSGRTLSRGNLFIYTLPSSPLGEAAIHFGFLGPMLYAAGKKDSLAELLDTAAEMILAKDAPVMLAGRSEENEGVYFVLDSASATGSGILCAFSEARPILEKGNDVSETIREMTLLAARKA
ncbi:MAG TPA: beta-ketoacyl synthase N-terminal-like domain-containing protein [Nitrospirota bacterium]